jgi:hypothetical protein
MSAGKSFSSAICRIGRDVPLAKRRCQEARQLATSGTALSLGVVTESAPPGRASFSHIGRSRTRVFDSAGSALRTSCPAPGRYPVYGSPPLTSQARTWRGTSGTRTCRARRREGVPRPHGGQTVLWYMASRSLGRFGPFQTGGGGIGFWRSFARIDEGGKGGLLSLLLVTFGVLRLGCVFFDGWCALVTFGAAGALKLGFCCFEGLRFLLMADSFSSSAGHFVWRRADPGRRIRGSPPRP